ncbi:DNA ligase D [Sphingomonas sp. AX6]|uniref:DNA ligase D n=1 Tax=Sphingomonas sp. AX6 TaxID=2653171 RepID=UPI0013580508|nr:DNA ligase D [Sphingomonas sp. AX6]
MAKPDPLAPYNAMRDFAKTAEPAGKRGKARAKNRIFMVQKHDATRLHFDFRLELDGVLKSWAVTKGPSVNPDDKRLAVRTEDHPMSYATFEGVIPKGEYGGGTVMLWDRGMWHPVPGKDPSKTIDEGHLHFTLDGERMKGEWLLVRMKPRGNEKRENWLLRKVADAHAGGSDNLVARELTSIESGRTMAEIASGKAPSPAAQPAAATRKAASGKLPAFRAPQLATLVDAVPAGNGWLHEVKYDGYRCVLSVGGGRARVFTRSGLDWSDKFAGIVEAATALDLPPALIDGEIVKLDANGNPSFSALQSALKSGEGGFTLFAFDVLSLSGKSLTKLSNVERKQKLAALLADAPGDGAIHYAEHVLGAGEQLFDALCKAGQEGIISKRADAPYRAGRTRNWLKVKCTRRQEFVILGWLKSDSKGRTLRSLLIGTRHGETLRYAGKVGTGFDTATEDMLIARLKSWARKTPPVEMSKAAARGVCWVTPDLVAEVAFAEFTADDVVRHASFLGLREDKQADQVLVERPAPTPPPTSAIRITNPDRLIFPASKVTKGDLAAYYEAIGPAMAPWAINRPISLVRCPQGRGKKCFFQKHDAGSFGDTVGQVDIREKDGGIEPYLYAPSIDALVACVQMGTIEFHGWGSRIDDVEKPDRLVFDLDPDEGLGFADVRSAAHDIRRTLDDLGLTSFAMLSGGKGLHVAVPLTPHAEWPAVKDFARRFALALAGNEPDRFVGTMSKAKRKDRIFIDWLRNQRGATAVLPYSARARDGAPVAAPIAWDELDKLEGGNAFSVDDVETLIGRASSRRLAGWGMAEQRLPDV